MSSAAWIPTEKEKWYVGWEKETGKMYYVHSSSQGIPRYNRIAPPIPPIPNHKTIIWTKYTTRASNYPNRASIVAFVNEYLRKNITYVLFGYKNDKLVHMEQIEVSK
jgi:hypothetical protein